MEIKSRSEPAHFIRFICVFSARTSGESSLSRNPSAIAMSEESAYKRCVVPYGEAASQGNEDTTETALEEDLP
jgi:hypothetical protein